MTDQPRTEAFAPWGLAGLPEDSITQQSDPALLNMQFYDMQPGAHEPGESVNHINEAATITERINDEINVRGPQMNTPAGRESLFKRIQALTGGQPGYEPDETPTDRITLLHLINHANSANNALPPISTRVYQPDGALGYIGRLAESYMPAGVIKAITEEREEAPFRQYVEELDTRARNLFAEEKAIGRVAVPYVPGREGADKTVPILRRARIAPATHTMPVRGQAQVPAQNLASAEPVQGPPRAQNLAEVLQGESTGEFTFPASNQIKTNYTDSKDTPMNTSPDDFHYPSDDERRNAADALMQSYAAEEQRHRTETQRHRVRQAVATGIGAVILGGAELADRYTDWSERLGHSVEAIKELGKTVLRSLF